MPRAGLTRDRVVAEAARMIDESGYDTLSLSAVADVLGVRPPSLYKHVTGLDDLRVGIAELAYRELEMVMRAAADASGSPIANFANAYRRFALERPGLASTVVLRVLPGYEETLQPAAAAATAPLIALVRGYGITEEHQVVHYARFVRSAVHGFVTIEAADGFQIPESIDDSFALLITGLEEVITRKGEES